MRHSEADGDPSLHGAVYRELFRSFTTDTERSGAASALDLPRPLARSLVHFLSLLSITPHLRHNHDLADQIAGAVALWFDSLWRQFERSERERDDLDPPLPSAETLSPESLTRSLSVIEPLRPACRDDWKRLRRRIDRISSAPERDRSLRAIHAEIATLYRRATRADSELRQERALRQVVTPLADHLNETTPELTRLAEEVRHHFRTPVQWNLFDTTWRNLDLSILRRALAIYDADPGLQRLTELIVQGSPVPEAPWRDERHADAYRETSSPGLHGTIPSPKSGAPLVAFAPGDIALLASDDTAPLFEQRLVEGGLAAYRPDRASAGSPPRRTVGAGTIPVSHRETARSPVVLCVDTSGSMRGLPERVAAAFALGVVRNALSRRRPFRILAFQKGLRELAWSPAGESRDDEGRQPSLTAPIRIPEDLLFDLSDMARTELEGGTDTSPVLERALAIVVEGPREPCDVVIVSDVTTPKITPVHLNRLYALQRLRRLRFHALTINRNPMSDPLNIFDHRWHYRDVDPPHRGVDIDAIRGVYLTP